MTTPESTGDQGAAPPQGRVRRPQPARTGPLRARTAPATSDAPEAVPPQAEFGGATPKNTDDTAISEAVSQAVKTGYEVIAENLKRGREAAERFRQGTYNIREVPGDLEAMSLRVLGLARELSITTFDVCERLLHEFSANAAQPPKQTAAGPFWPTVKKAPAPAKGPAGPSPSGPGAMKLNVVFNGAAKAVAHTDALSRPIQPTAPEEVSAVPLAARSGGGAPIAGVGFQADLANGGLIATIALPDGQAPGIYSGLVYAAGQDVPLGVLTVEVAK
ncbi:MAG: hypothetical protein ABSD80_14680 [Caulobacteraceae bacterium]|jgi:hypothetical protein